MENLSQDPNSVSRRFEGLFPPDVKTIALVAPSMPASDSQTIDSCIQLLREAGVRVKVMPHAREGEPGLTRDSIVDIKRRAADFEQAWLDPEADLILCIRGGWGAIDLVNELDWNRLRTRPDMRVIGFSDITIVHLAMLHEKAGHPICGPSLRGLHTVDRESLEVYTTVLSGGTPAPVQLTALRGGEASGMILAGHLHRLSLVNHTRFKPDVHEKVVFTECPSLDASKVQECWDDLREDGFFSRCSAVVFGRLNGCGEEEEAVIHRLAESVSCPVFCGFPYSHTPQNHMLDLRRSVRLAPDGQLFFL